MKWLVCIGAAWVLAVLPADAQEKVLRVNLLGYPLQGPKRALLLSRSPVRAQFWLVAEQGGARQPIVPRLSDRKPWAPFAHAYELLFDGVSAEGSYRLEEEQGPLRSPTFRIGRYAPVQEEVVRFMQSQRCGYNPFIDRVCHPYDGRSFYGKQPDSSYVDARGGWHDAGDQLKYLITGSNATARMLMAWEWYGDAFGDRADAWGRPGANGLPDILDEAKWGLDWIHRLHPEPDQLIHQVADDRDHYRGFKMPDNDSSDFGWGANSYRTAYFATGRPQGRGRFLSEATGVANVAGRSAAAMAIGHRIWKRLGDSVFSRQCLQDALTLYQMGRAKEGFQQGNSYGAPYRYNERTWADDMEWAAAELYKATGRQEYLADAIRYADQVNTDSWMERDTVSHYEMYPYVNIGHHALWEVADNAIRRRLEGYYRHNLERIRTKALQNDYGVGHLFVWCSNNFAAAVATQALLYERMTGDTRYRSLLQDHVNWLLGLNPWGSSMITGIPADGDYPLDVHMPFWRLLGKVVPGSLVDGPLAASIHEHMLQIRLSEPDEYAALQPGHVTYWDDWADYSTNEPTMDGSADLFLILAHLHLGR